MNLTHRLLPLVLLAFVGCTDADAGGAGAIDPDRAPATRQAPAAAKGQAVAVFAGGCFWCMEKPFEKIDGVIEVTSGYAGGKIDGPSYKEIGSGATQHIEAIHVLYEPGKVGYARLLEVFWHNIDPTQDDGQFCDRGHQYTTAVFTSDPEEGRLALESKKAVASELGTKVVTDIRPAATFWIAEDYHQDFYKTNPEHYQRYRTGCGRDRRLQQLWGDKAGH